MIAGGLDALSGKRVLLLQSPVGPFFRRLAQDLRWVGAQVCKVNFNGGDLLFYPSGAVNFRGEPHEWSGFLDRLIDERRIDVVLMFGDCRPIHRVAREIASARGIEIGVFEEGYIRPNFITFERFGVNGHSQLPRSPLFYRNRDVGDPLPSKRVEGTFANAAMWATLYYMASALFWPWFRRYRHHRRLSLLEALPWLRSGWRRRWYAWRERRMQPRLAGELSGRFFLVPLQVHNDAQIHAHSDFDSVEKFIAHVVRSFASAAPADTHLVIKHHPMDRGYHDYGRLIRRHERSFGLEGRLHYIHDQHLPTLLDHARGCVLVNSTVGMSALFHGTPLKVCGAAIYDMPGLTYTGSLEHFWVDAPDMSIDSELFRRFRNYVIRRTQLNGSFYRRLDLPGSCSGVVWPHSAPVRVPMYPQPVAADVIVQEAV